MRETQLATQHNDDQTVPQFPIKMVPKGIS